MSDPQETCLLSSFAMVEHKAYTIAPTKKAYKAYLGTSEHD